MRQFVRFLAARVDGEACEHFSGDVPEPVVLSRQLVKGH